MGPHTRSSNLCGTALFGRLNLSMHGKKGTVTAQSLLLHNIVVKGGNDGKFHSLTANYGDSVQIMVIRWVPECFVEVLAGI